MSNPTMTEEFPYLPQPCNKSTWPPGPWHGEADSASWIDSLTGYRCAMIRHSHSGHWCGYVKVPDWHPLTGKSYNDRALIPPGWMERSVNIDEGVGALNLLTAGPRMNGNSAELCLLLFCHGGLTYGNGGWLGFDCAHAGDFQPWRGAGGEGTYRDAAYVRANCERLAKQIHDYATAMENRT